MQGALGDRSGVLRRVVADGRGDTRGSVRPLGTRARRSRCWGLGFDVGAETDAEGSGVVVVERENDATYGPEGRVGVSTHDVLGEAVEGAAVDMAKKRERG